MKALVSGELTVFMWSFLCGIVITVFYDLIKCIYANESYSVTVYNVCDAVFVICACAFMIFVLFSVSNGYVRSYEFAGAFLGAILYKITLSRFVSAIFYRITEVFFAVFNFFLKILLTPLAFMYKIIHNTISIFASGMRKLFAPLSQKALRIFRLVKITLKKT